MDARYADRKVYHFTPISNLSTILEYGLLSITEQQRRDLSFRSVAWSAILEHRAGQKVPIPPGGVVLDYVPFYFTHLTHMLLVILSNKVVDEQEIIHFELPITVMEQYPSVFTDAPTIPRSEPHFYNDSADLDRLDWDAIDSAAWQNEPVNLRNARLAELLIYQQIPITHASRVIVWNNLMAERVMQAYQHFGMRLPNIEIDPTFYFLDPSSEEMTPVISGPKQIREAYERAVQNILERRKGRQPFPFQNLEELRDALRSDLGVLPETKELVGLETDNKAHFEDVGSHTSRVVAELLKTSEFQELPAEDQILLEVATFLHDIGKGPKSRWEAYGGKQQIDMNHPVKALPMMERILSEEVRDLTDEQIIQLCKLVAYHDIIGGMIASGRRMEELLEIVGNEKDFDMLMALSKADAQAINPAWANPPVRERLRTEVLQKMHGR